MIAVNDLQKHYLPGKRNEVAALRGVTLELGERGLVAVFGKSGCGKTTLLNAIGGLDDFDGGSVEIDGNRFSRSVADGFRTANIGYIFQNYLLDENVNVYDNVARALYSLGMRDREEIFNRVMTALKSVGMAKYYNRRIETLSGGQQQRVAIARAIVKGCKIILADEPTGNLDEENTRAVMDILKALSRSCLVLLVTHERDLIERYADRVVSMSDGKVAESTVGGDVPSGDDRTKVFLGDLAKDEITAGEIRVETYGQPSPVSLTLAFYGGKVYVSAKGDGVRFVDGDGETSLIPQTKQEYFESRRQTTASELETLGRVDPRGLGRVFTARESFLCGVSNVVGKKKKRYLSLAFAVLAFAVALFALVAYFGAAYRSYINAGAGVHPYRVTAMCGSDSDMQRMTELSKEYGGYYSFRQDAYGDGDVAFTFALDGFESFAASGGGSYPFYDKSVARGKFVAGGADASANTIYLSSALADGVLDRFKKETSLPSLGYADILHGVGIMRGGYGDGGRELRIAGVVEGEHACVYLDDGMLEIDMLCEMYGVRRGGDFGLDVPRGEAWADAEFAANNPELADGGNIEIGGKTFALRLVDKRTGGALVMNEADISGLNFDYGVHGYAKAILYATRADALATRLNAEFVGCYASSRATLTADARNEAKQNMILRGLGALAVCVLLFAAMCLLVYVSTSSRMKEIGIYRAVGVSPRNVLKRFFFEGLALTVIAVGTAILLCGLPLCVASSALTFGAYLPPWMLAATVGALGVMLPAACVLPVLPAARRSPVRILTKYDL